MRALLVALAATSGCASSNILVCSEDLVCPDTAICDVEHHLCLTPDQLAQCTDVADGTLCIADVVSQGVCDGGVCVQPFCGDNYRGDSEICDGDKLSLTSCRDLGYYNDAPLTCTNECTFITTQCVGRCMDGVRQTEFELCDGAPPTESCVDFGYGAGFLDCVQCGPGIADCKQFDWDLPKSLPVAVDDLHATAIDDVWAVGDRIMHFDGLAWAPADLTGCAGTSRYTGVWSTGADTFVVGPGGVALHITATGCMQAVLGGALTLDDVWGTSASDVYAVGLEGLFHFDGSAWSAVTLSQFAQTAPSTVWASAPNNVWAGKKTLRHYDGQTWSTVAINALSQPLDNFRAIWGTGPTDIYVAGYPTGYPDQVWHYNGADWTRLPDPPGDVFSGVSTAGRVLVSGNASPTVGPHVGYVALWDGTSWLDLGLPHVEDNDVAGLTPTPSGHLFVIARTEKRVFRAHGSFTAIELAFGTQFGADFGDRLVVQSSTEAYARTQGTGVGVVYKFWEYDGTTWAEDSNLGFIDAFAIEPAGRIYVVDGLGLKSRTKNDSTWTTCDDTIVEATALWAPAPNDVWVATPISLRHADCAKPYDEYTTTATIGALWGSSSTDVFGVGADGAIVHWAGSTWSAMTSGTSVDLTAVWGSGPDDVYAVGHDGVVLHYTSGVWTNESFGSGLPFVTVWGTGAGDVFVGGEQGELFHRDATGRWSPMRSGATSQITAIAGGGDTVSWFDQNGDLHRLTRTFNW